MKKSLSLFSLFYLVTFLFLSSCDKADSIKTKEDFKLFNLQQAGWKSKRIIQSVGGINYTATEVPLQYYILKNGENNSKIVDSIYNANNRERIVEIEFEQYDKEDLLLEKYTKKDYESSVKYLAFSIEKDFTVVTSSNDTISCSGALFERNFKVAPFKRALLYFNNIPPNDNIKLIYNDQLFGNGLIPFNFKEVPIKL